jgi:hypothetical protein
MAKKPMGLIFAGDTNKAQQEVESIIRLLVNKQDQMDLKK